MIDWMANAHPYLGYVLVLIVWCLMGYLEVRLVSPLLGYITWLFAIFATSLAVLRIRGLILPGWFLALLVLIVGNSCVVLYYRWVRRKHREDPTPVSDGSGYFGRR